MQKNSIEIAVGSILIFISSSILLWGRSLVEGGMSTGVNSLFLPHIIAILVIALSGLMIFSAIKSKSDIQPSERTDEPKGGYIEIGKYVAAFLIYLLILQYIGFMLSTFLMMFFVMYQMGGRKWFIMLAIAISASVILYYACYHLLHVMLPFGSIFE
jgi:putative tricarboxylic transport membrane protein